MSLIEGILHTHGGLISVACIVGFFSVVSWACDEWTRRRTEKSKDTLL